MFLPYPVIEQLTEAQVDTWERHFAGSGHERPRSIEEGIWRRTQEPANAEQSGWSADDASRRRIVHYRNHYGLDYTFPVLSAIAGCLVGSSWVGMASVQLTGEDHLVGFDRLRADVVGEGLLPALVPAATTAATLAARFGSAQWAGIEIASAKLTAKAVRARPVADKGRLLRAGVLLVGDLCDGRSDGRTVSLDQVDRAVDAVRAAGATGQVLFQGDSGYYSHKVAEKIVARDCLFRLSPCRAPLRCGGPWRACTTTGSRHATTTGHRSR